MSFAQAAHYVIAGLLTLVLGWAAATDIKSRRISNWSVICVIALFAAWVAVDGGRGLLSGLEACGVALVVSAALYAFGVVGAGDSKLFAATALFAGLGFLPLMTVVCTLTGGAIAAVSLVTRPRRALAMFVLRGRGDWGRGVPYGVAIAAGALFVVWASQAGLVEPLGARPHLSITDLSAFR